jgi:Protein of unknown function (DUF2630)
MFCSRVVSDLLSAIGRSSPQPCPGLLATVRSRPMQSPMNIFPQAGVPPTPVKDLSPIPPELELFARIEGLVGEEAALLAIAHENRDREQRERLGAVSAELDRIWERLRERADRLGHEHGSCPD